MPDQILKVLIELPMAGAVIFIIVLLLRDREARDKRTESLVREVVAAVANSTKAMENSTEAVNNSTAATYEIKGVVAGVKESVEHQQKAIEQIQKDLSRRACLHHTQKIHTLETET